MSEPYIYVWASDMRADPKIIGLNGDEKWALIQAWDLAKNGPGDPDELRDVDGSPMTASTLRKIADVSPTATRGLFEKWQRRGLCTVGTEARATAERRESEARAEREETLSEARGNVEDTLVRFPRLRRRQRLDATNAARQARFREKRNAKSNGESNAESNGASNSRVTPYTRAGPEPEPETPLTPQRAGGDLTDIIRPGTRGTGTSPREIAATAERTSRRAGAIAACRRLNQQYLDDGTTPETAHEWLLNEYRHDPSIVTEALGPPPEPAAAIDPGDIAL